MADRHIMHLHFGMLIDPIMVWLPVSIIAAGVVIVSLKAIAADCDFALRKQRLQKEVQALRQRQTERLKALNVGRSRC